MCVCVAPSYATFSELMCRGCFVNVSIRTLLRNSAFLLLWLSEVVLCLKRVMSLMQGEGLHLPVWLGIHRSDDDE